MSEYWITLQLISEATFGRGEGIAGLIDREVEHDRYGLPYLRGRTLKGLISEEADNLLFALKLMDPGIETDPTNRWVKARQTLFGSPGSTADDRARLRFGHAELPAAVREAVRKFGGAGSDANRLMILESLTNVRRQTAVENEGERYGVPAEGSLRAMRTILRETEFEAQLVSEKQLEDDELGLLAAAVMAFRRAGTGRNRGRGKLVADLRDDQRKSVLLDGYAHFSAAALGLPIAQKGTTS